MEKNRAFLAFQRTWCFCPSHFFKANHQVELRIPSCFCRPPSITCSSFLAHQENRHLCDLRNLRGLHRGDTNLNQHGNIQSSKNIQSSLWIISGVTFRFHGCLYNSEFFLCPSLSPQLSPHLYRQGTCGPCKKRTQEAGPQYLHRLGGNTSTVKRNHPRGLGVGTTSNSKCLTVMY